MVAFGVLTPEQVYRDAINWDTLVLLLGMMILSSLMARAGIFRWVSWAALERAHGPRTLLLAIVAVAGGLSALLVNDTICLMCTPIVLALVGEARLPPLPYLLGLAFASNAGSVATLFGVPRGVARAGIADRLYRGLEPAFGSDPVQQTFRFGAFTVAACQLVSNVPFVLVASHWIPKMADPHLSWLSLALVSTLAGNLTPVASVANLIVLELAGNKGKIPFLRFLLVGAGATFFPLAARLATLLAERRLGLLGP